MKYLFIQLLMLTAAVSNGANPWFDAIKAGDTAAVTNLLDAGADIEAKNEWEGTGLAQAVWSGKQEMIPILLARGANPNASGQYGTPLCLAIDKWDTIAIRMLLEDPRTDVQLARRDGAKPIDLVQYTDKSFNPAIAEALIKRGASVNSVNSEGNTPLIRCARTGSEKWTAFLVKRGADIHFKNPHGDTAYMTAAQYGRVDIMKILEERGGKVPVLVKPSPQAAIPPTPEQLWVLATAAILNQRNEDGHEAMVPASFTSDDRMKTVKLLRDEWGIKNYADLIQILDAVTSAPEPPQYQAWTLCRCVNLAQWGVRAGYMTEYEGWNRMFLMAHRIQETYSSWAEMADSYLAGRRRWYRTMRVSAERKQDAQKNQAQMEFIVQMLLNPQDPNSPWNKCKWETELGTPPTPVAKPVQAPPPVAVANASPAASNNEWRSTEANCYLKIPLEAGWTPQINKPMQLSLQHSAAGSFHVLCTESRKPELTPEMTSSAKANSKVRSQAGGNRSELVSGDWLTFHGARAYQWVDKQMPPGKPAFFRAQMLFIRKGRYYTIQASNFAQDPFKDPAIAPLLSALQFLDE